MDATVSQLSDYARVRRIPAQRTMAEQGVTAAREFNMRLPAGAPITNDARADEPCDLNSLLVQDPESTFLYTVSGDSMDRAGILDGDRVVVDRALQPVNGDIVVAVLAAHGHTVKRLQAKRNEALLTAESSNSANKSFQLRPDDGDVIWGVVTGVIRRMRKGRRSAKRILPKG